MRGGKVVGFRDLLVGTERAAGTRYAAITRSLPLVTIRALPPELLASSRYNLTW